MGGKVFCGREWGWGGGPSAWGGDSGIRRVGGGWVGGCGGGVCLQGNWWSRVPDRSAGASIMC